MTEYRHIINVKPDKYHSIINETGEILRQGGVVIYPTDTVYGLGGLISNEESLERIFSLKKRPLNLALPVIIAEYEDLSNLVSFVSEEAWKVMHEFWPGALTIILSARDGLSPILLGGKKTIGVRMPGYQFCRDIVRSAGGPLVSTSANNSGEPPANEINSISQSLKDSVNLIIDGGTIISAGPSTVIDMSGGKILIRREGNITKEKLRKVLPDIE